MLWVSLDAADATTGALCFLPGTQREARREAPTSIDEGFGDEGIGAMLLTRPEWAEIEPVCVHTQPGDALLIDPMVAHAAVSCVYCIISAPCAWGVCQHPLPCQHALSCCCIAIVHCCAALLCCIVVLRHQLALQSPLAHRD